MSGRKINWIFSLRPTLLEVPSPSYRMMNYDGHPIVYCRRRQTVGGGSIYPGWMIALLVTGAIDSVESINDRLRKNDEFFYASKNIEKKIHVSSKSLWTIVQEKQNKSKFTSSANLCKTHSSHSRPSTNKQTNQPFKQRWRLPTIFSCKN